MPVAELAADSAWLFLWVTGPFIPQAFTVIEYWGFQYSGIGFTWAKTNPRAPALFLDAASFHVGMGFTTRKNTELCLLGRRGAPKRLRCDVRELIIAPRREHSRKPEEFYERVIAFADGPRLELFARQQRDGFTAWGNETTKFNTGIGHGGKEAVGDPAQAAVCQRGEVGGAGAVAATAGSSL